MNVWFQSWRSLECVNSDVLCVCVCVCVCVCILASAIENWRFYLQTPYLLPHRNRSPDGTIRSLLYTADVRFTVLLHDVKSSKINVIFTPVTKGTNLPERPRVPLYTWSRLQIAINENMQSPLIWTRLFTNIILGFIMRRRNKGYKPIERSTPLQSSDILGPPTDSHWWKDAKPTDSNTSIHRHHHEWNYNAPMYNKWIRPTTIQCSQQLVERQLQQMWFQLFVEMCV